MQTFITPVSSFTGPLCGKQILVPTSHHQTYILFYPQTRQSKISNRRIEN